VAVCQFHRDRPGVGVCVRCRRVICAACCTRLDGINHCHACLRALGAGREEGRPRRPLGPLAAALFLAGAWGFLLLLGWLAQGWLAP
jgi:hypothetical protein